MLATWNPTRWRTASATALGLAVLLLGTACAARPAPANTSPATATPATGAGYSVAIFGDMPYLWPDTAVPRVLAEYPRLLADIAAADVQAVIHVGDFTGYACGDEVFAQRLHEFEAMPHPLVFLFGDNEWIDCRRDGYDPLERLERLRTLFTAGERSLGQRSLALQRQSASPTFAAYRENVRWEEGGVLFVGLHLVPLPRGTQDSLAIREEFELRNAANLAWLAESFALARAQRARGIAIALQANPGWGEGEPARPEHRALVAALRREAAAGALPVAVIHGDTHTCRIDRPFPELPHVLRGETFGEKHHHWLELLVAPPGVEPLFRFVPRAVAGNAPGGCEIAP